MVFFLILAIVNSGIMNIGVHMSFQTNVLVLFMGLHPRVELLGYIVGLTECGPLEKGMANHFSILALRTP